MSWVTKDRVEEPILRWYKYGSSVYGTTNKNSDEDFIAVVQSDEDFNYDVRGKNGDITVYSESAFIRKIKEHQISVLECIFQDANDPYVKYFELDSEKLRRAISSVSSNSFVKCKKKINDGQVYIGLKSMFHSLRILMFGMQIAEFGKIVDYSCANSILTILMAIGGDWESIEQKYKPLFNELKTKFRLLAPIKEETEK